MCRNGATAVSVLKCRKCEREPKGHEAKMKILLNIRYSQIITKPSPVWRQQ